MKTKGKVLLSSIASIALCSSIAVGGTFALFTSESTVNIAVTSGKVDVVAEIVESTLKTSSTLSNFEGTNSFENRGTATFSTVNGAQTLNLTNITPGDKAEFKITVTNNSNVDVQYRFTWTVDGVLSEVWEATVNGNELVSNATDWATWKYDAANTQEFQVAVWLPKEVSDEKYEGETTNISFYVEAVQGNGANFYKKDIAENIDELREALTEGTDIVLTKDIEAPASNGGYNIAGIVQNGSTIDGNGNTLTINNANDTWDCAVYTTGGTIKNLTIGGAFRGIFTAGCSSDIIIDNVKIDNVCYTISSDASNPNYSIIVTNSTLNGWTSYTGGYKSVSFTDCNFGKGTGGYQYAYCRPYSATTFTNCVFEEGFEFDATLTTNKFIDCYVGDTLITAENVVELLGEDAANVVFPAKVSDKEGFENALENSYIVLTNDVDFGGATIALSDDVTISGDVELNNVTFTVANGKAATFEGVEFTDATTIQATQNGALNFTDCTFDIAPNKLSNNSRAAAIIGSNQYATVDLYLDGCTFNYQNAGADTYNAAIFMWSSIKNCEIKNCTFNGYGFVAVKLMNVAEGANIVFENNTFDMSAVGSANYWYNCAVQIVPQHDNTLSVTFKNNNFNGGYQSGSDLSDEFGFTADNTNSIVVEIAVMHYTSLSKLTFAQEGNTVNGVVATNDNFAIKEA